MDVLFFALGSHGDVHPMLGLATAMRERGHSVTVATSPYYQELFDRTGVPLIPLGTTEELLSAMRDPALWDPNKAFDVVVDRMMLRFMRPVYDLIAERSRPADFLVVAPPTALGARIAQEKLRISLATIHLAPSPIRSVYLAPVLPPMMTGKGVPRWLKRFQYWLIDNLIIDRKMAGPINQFRSELNLPPVRGIMNQWWHSTQLALCLFPEWFGPRQPDWPGQIVYTGFPLWDERGVAVVEPRLEEFLQAGEPPIVFTPGSAMLHGHKFFLAAIEACEKLGRRGILLTRHTEQLPAELPPHIRQFDFVPLSQLLPRCAAIVHHAGVGTVGQGLAAGIPHVAMPMAHDQHDNAARLIRLGVGTSILPNHFTGVALATALDALLASPTVRTRCLELAAKVRTNDSLQQSCDELERIAGLPVESRQPVATTN